MSTPLISAENPWALGAVACIWVAFSVWLEQKYAWAAKLSGALLCAVGALLLVQLGVIPAQAPLFDTGDCGYILALSLPFLLMKCNIRKVPKEAGKLFILFGAGAVGTVLASMGGILLLRRSVGGSMKTAGLLLSYYVGGEANLSVLSASVSVSEATVSALLGASRLVMAVTLFLLLTFSSSPLLLRHFSHPHINAAAGHSDIKAGKREAAAYYGKNNISLKYLAIEFAICVLIVAVSTWLAQWLFDAVPASGPVLTLLRSLVGNRYLIITFLSVAAATLLSHPAERAGGGREIGTYLLYLFFFATGVHSSPQETLRLFPPLLLCCLFVAAVNILCCFLAGKLMHCDLEEILLAANAGIGGSASAASLAISKSWTALVGPVLMLGTLECAFGTFLGLLVGNLL